MIRNSLKAAATHWHQVCEESAVDDDQTLVFGFKIGDGGSCHSTLLCGWCTGRAVHG